VTEAFAHVTRVLERNGCDPHEKNGRWVFYCPTHGSRWQGHRDGRHPAGGLAEGREGRVLVNCAAGCDTPTILEAIGLSYSDLFVASPDDWESPDIAMVYDYTDPDGSPRFQVVRFPKGHEPQFLQRRWDGVAHWAWHLGPCEDRRPACAKGRHQRLTDRVETIPYRLHKLVLAPYSEHVWVVEGEKDVLTMEGLGFIATTNPGGSSELGKRCKWRTEFGPWFAGRPVVVVADQDRPGLNHAIQVARMLHLPAASVRIVDLLPGAKDVTDLREAIEAKGGDDELVRRTLECLADRPPMTLDDWQTIG
jgi:putative DNA primase/helicase